MVSDVCQINEVDHLCSLLDKFCAVSDVCQINEVDHLPTVQETCPCVSDVCQINEVDHRIQHPAYRSGVSDVCQINEVDHNAMRDRSGSSSLVGFWFRLQRVICEEGPEKVAKVMRLLVSLCDAPNLCYSFHEPKQHQNNSFRKVLGSYGAAVVLVI